MTLIIENLHVSVHDTPIVKGLNLTINNGEIHAIMGPNGAGKSTLSYVLSGRQHYNVTQGSISYNGHDILALEPHERAHLGLFLSFQYPVEIPGVTVSVFLRHAVNAHRKAHGLDEYDLLEFVKILRAKAAELDINTDMLKRGVNSGFSGGEKKRFEALQISLLEPSLAILDETDSGLDIDALRDVAASINKTKKDSTSLLVITHYQRLLNYIKPDMVHILYNGSIIESGGADLVDTLEIEGYNAFISE